MQQYSLQAWIHTQGGQFAIRINGFPDKIDASVSSVESREIVSLATFYLPISYWESPFHFHGDFEGYANSCWRVDVYKCYISLEACNSHLTKTTSVCSILCSIILKRLGWAAIKKKLSVSNTAAGLSKQMAWFGTLSMVQSVAIEPHQIQATPSCEPHLTYPVHDAFTAHMRNVIVPACSCLETQGELYPPRFNSPNLFITQPPSFMQQCLTRKPLLSLTARS